MPRADRVDAGQAGWGLLCMVDTLRGPIPPTPVEMPDHVRLAKRVADLARCSRIEAEQYIKGGWVSVDGRVTEDPAHPVSGELVAIDPSAQLETV
jgi:23S rRNA pseudouridine2604 synthase